MITEPNLIRVWLPLERRAIPIDLARIPYEALGIETIAWALSFTNRYGGHTPFPYSVALHSIICSYLVAPAYRKEALMHDAAEAYLGDLIRPVKRIPEVYAVWKGLEREVDLQIRREYRMPYHESPAVKLADEKALAAEQLILRDVPLIPGALDQDDLRIVNDLINEIGTDIADVYNAFLARYSALSPGQVRLACVR